MLFLKISIRYIVFHTVDLCKIAKIADINQEGPKHDNWKFLIAAQAPHAVRISVVARSVLDPARQLRRRSLYRMLYYELYS
jgi:hypothetical protein